MRNRIFILSGIMFLAMGLVMQAQVVELTKMDINKSAKWIYPFPEGGLGTQYEIQAPHEKANDLFEVDGKKIKVLYNWPDRKAPFGMITTTKKYSSFNAEFQYKWGERKFAPRDTNKRDAGFLYHINGEKMPWPTSLECQVQEDDTGDLWVIKGPRVTVVNLDGTLTKVDTSVKKNFHRVIRYRNYEKKGWNKVRVEVRGNSSARYFVNGKLVNEIHDFYDKEGNPLTNGYICLQAEGAEITYKNVRMQILK